MITHETLDGVAATVIWLDDRLQPVDKDKATGGKALLDDGRVIWFTTPR